MATMRISAVIALLALAKCATGQPACETRWLPGWPAPMLQFEGQGAGTLRHLSTFDPDGVGPLPERLLAAGQFSLIDGFPCRGVAEWDGTRWLAPLPANTPTLNLDGACYHNGELYIVGQFSAPGNVAGVGRWDGTAFRQVGTLLTQRARCAVSFNGELYIGGDFTAVAGVPGTAALARWNGSAWQPVGTGLTRAGGGASARALLVTADGLVVAGDFDTAGGLASPDVAIWNGAQWSARAGLDAGSSFRINAITMHEGALHAAGMHANSTPVWRWDAGQNAWTPLASSTSGEVFTLASFADHLYAGGNFLSINAVQAPLRLAKWDGQAWTGAIDPSPLLVQVGSGILKAAPFGGRLVLGGQQMGYRTVGGTSGPYRAAVLTYDGAEWRTFATGLDGAPLDMLRVGPDIILAGPFRVAGGRRVNGIARWNGSEFLPMGQGLYSNTGTTTGEIASDLEVGPDGMLYVCGLFTASDPGPPARFLDGVARWDGSVWRRTAAPGGHPTGQMYDFAIFNNQLFVTGNGAITGAGGVLAYTGATWQGTGWPFGTAPFCIEPFQGVLYVGPYRWTGTTFPSVQGGPQSMVDLRELNGRFFGLADGAFPTGGSCVGELRDGVWTTLGTGLFSGLSNSLSGALNWYHGDLIAARAFTGIDPVSRVIRWNGAVWRPIAGDPDTLPPDQSSVARAGATLLDGEVLWVSGLFLNAGGVPSPYLARYTATAPAPTFTLHPSDIFGCADEVAVFNADATAGATLRWRRNGVALTEGQTLPTGGVVTGVATGTLSIANPGPGAVGDFDCVASTPCGSATSNAARLRPCCEPDVNRDGNIDQDDVAYLLGLLTGAPNPMGIDPDFNRDGNADQDDLAALVEAVAGGGCP
jgi:trimeric autotransporter adhesin